MGVFLKKIFPCKQSFTPPSILVNAPAYLEAKNWN